jgi:hypothetical protein
MAGGGQAGRGTACRRSAGFQMKDHRRHAWTSEHSQTSRSGFYATRRSAWCRIPSREYDTRRGELKWLMTQSVLVARPLA